MSLERSERSSFVSTHKATVANNVGHQDCYKLALHMCAPTLSVLEQRSQVDNLDQQPGRHSSQNCWNVVIYRVVKCKT